jgi:predicted nucleotidyltransferase
MDIMEIRRIAEPACEKFAVKRLDVFGSLARGENGPKSDVDLLVEFNDPPQELSKRFFGLLHYLEDSLGTKIDLLTISSLTNPYFRQKVLSERQTIYEG